MILAEKISSFSEAEKKLMSFYKKYKHSRVYILCCAFFNDDGGDGDLGTHS